MTSPDRKQSAVPEVPSLDSVREALVPILKKGSVAKAIVFGSYARGEADQHSDLDLIIVAESERTFFHRHKDFPDIYEYWRKGLDMLIYTPDELSDMLDEHRAFIEQALEEGVVIYEE